MWTFAGREHPPIRDPPGPSQLCQFIQDHEDGTDQIILMIIRGIDIVFQQALNEVVFFACLHQMMAGEQLFQLGNFELVAVLESLSAHKVDCGDDVQLGFHGEEQLRGKAADCGRTTRASGIPRLRSLPW